jgi:predicted DsbA family dithiol-disulfide isomerase
MAKRRFEWAFAAFERRAEVDVTLLPYQLAPTHPTAAATEASVKVAAAGGIDYRPEQVVSTDTMPAHRLIWLAGQEHGSTVARRVMDRIFLAYFTEGRDIADVETLSEIARTSGMDADRVQGFVAADEGLAEVEEELQQAHERGIAAVPTFVFGNGRVVIGAEDSVTYLDLLEELARDTDENVTRADLLVSEERACA